MAVDSEKTGFSPNFGSLGVRNYIAILIIRVNEFLDPTSVPAVLKNLGAEMQLSKERVGKIQKSQLGECLDGHAPNKNAVLEMNQWADGYEHLATLLRRGEVDRILVPARRAQLGSGLPDAKQQKLDAMDFQKMNGLGQESKNKLADHFDELALTIRDLACTLDAKLGTAVVHGDLQGRAAGRTRKIA